MNAPRMPEVRNQYFALQGGLDVESAHLARRPGLVMGSRNYESSSENGYERVGGYERFDGRPRPSDAPWRLLRLQADVPAISPGLSLWGGASGATGRVLSNHRTDQIVIARMSGTFMAGEDIVVAGTGVGKFKSLSRDVNSVEDNQYSALAAVDLQQDIGPVPGSGPVRGIVWLGSTCYAFRDNAGGTALGIYKSSSSGWQAVPLLREIAFTGGSGTAPAEGSVITKGSTSAIVRRLMVQKGTWGASTAEGRMVLDTIVGGPFTAGAFTAGITATASGADTAITLSPGGRIDARVHSFTGSPTRRAYCADGVNRAFEFDGTVLAPIATGMASDKPRHVEVHRNHLFLFFGPSIQHSGIGSPFEWTAVSGAGEMVAGDEVTGSSVLPGDTDSSAMLVLTPQRTLILYGNTPADWQLRDFNAYVGAQRWSIQNLGTPIAFDAQGVVVVSQTQQFGNFHRDEVSRRLRTFLAGRTVTASVVNRLTGRMRIFFEDGGAISITAVGKGLAFMPIDYGRVVRCTCAAMVNGEHRNFFGSDDGYVYEADRGRSFAGGRVTAWLKLAFNVMKSPGMKKRFRWAELEVKPSSACTLQFQAEFSLGAIDISRTVMNVKPIDGLGGVWDITNWDECYYDTPAQSMTKLDANGVGTSLSLSVFCESAQELPHQLQSANLFFNLLRLDRT